MDRRSFLQFGIFGFAAGILRQPLGLLRAFAADRKPRLRGLTVDAARLPEKPEYYRRLIDFCHDWDLNALLFRLTDDQGSAFRFDSHPELVTHQHALTPSQARALAEYGRKRQVTLIPEIESFGHTTYITSVPKWQHLADTPGGAPTEYFGISPVHPDSLRLMRDLYTEAAQAFDSPWLHGGCDEVNWGGSELSRKALEKKSRAEIWADYLNSLDGICRELGKELIVWGDFVAHKEPEILTHLNRRVIVMDWQYYQTDPQPLKETAEKVIGAGLRVLGAPAVISCEWGPRAGELTLRNIDAYADAYGDIPDERCLGVIVTNWMPSRYLQNSLWDSFAYAAVALQKSAAKAKESALPQFVERFYGAKWDPEWKSIFADLYRLTPGRHCADWKVPQLPLPPANQAQLKRTLDAPPLEPLPYQDLARRVHAQEKSVIRNREAFRSFALSVDYLAHVTARTGEWKNVTVNPADAKKTLQAMAQRDRELLARLEAEWNQGRFEDSPGKRENIFGLTPYDQLLLQFRRATEFTEQLAQKGGPGLQACVKADEDQSAIAAPQSDPYDRALY